MQKKSTLMLYVLSTVTLVVFLVGDLKRAPKAEVIDTKANKFSYPSNGITKHYMKILKKSFFKLNFDQ